jgi:predicted small lipoprotein YifL
MRFNFCLGLLIFTLAGCGDDAPSTQPAPAKQAPPLEIKMPEGVRPETKKLLTAAWPKIRQACSGLDTYAASLREQSVEEGYRPGITVKIPESDTGIPGEYMARGHTCFFDVSKDGRRLVIAKEGCQNLCLDRQRESNGDLTLFLTGVPSQSQTSVPADETPYDAALRAASAVCVGTPDDLVKSAGQVTTIVNDVTPYQVFDALAIIFEGGTKKRHCDNTLDLYVFERTNYAASHAETVAGLRKLAYNNGPVD